MAPEAVEIGGNIRSKINDHRIPCLARVAVRFAVADGSDVAGITDNPLGEKESGGQLKIVSGRAHGDGNGLIVEADLERLLYGQKILYLSGRLSFHSFNGNRENATRH
jgi:hypothetical protein